MRPPSSLLSTESKIAHCICKGATQQRKTKTLFFDPSAQGYSHVFHKYAASITKLYSIHTKIIHIYALSKCYIMSQVLSFLKKGTFMVKKMQIRVKMSCHKDYHKTKGWSVQIKNRAKYELQITWCIQQWTSKWQCHIKVQHTVKFTQIISARTDSISNINPAHCSEKWLVNK